MRAWAFVSRSLRSLRLLRRVSHLEAIASSLVRCNDCGGVFHLAHPTVKTATTTGGKSVSLCKWCAQRVIARAKGR